MDTKAGTEMLKKGPSIRKKRNALVVGICFEPLEPRLLLSGSGAVGIDSPAPDSHVNIQHEYTQDTVAFFENVATAAHQSDHPLASGTVVDVLAQAPALDESVFTDPVSETASSQGPAAPASSDIPATSRVHLSGNSSNRVRQTSRLDVAGVRELIFVNDNVADYQQLIDDLQGGDANRIIEVVVLEPDRDGIDQVSETLAGRSDLAALHFITHGADGQINLGNTFLNNTTLQQNRDVVADWGSALTDTGDILFYGCELASSSNGKSLLNNIADLTKADVAASDDNTGHAILGADWDLEYNAGAIETRALFSAATQDSWGHLLNVAVENTSTGTSTTDSLTISHTTSGTDRLMLVGVSINKGTGTAVTSITYNGDALTLVGTSSNGDAVAEIWKLVNPDVGTYNVNIVFNGTTDGNAAGVMTFTGVDQTISLGLFGSGSGNSGGSGSATISSAPGDLVFGIIAVDEDSNYDLNPGADQTEAPDGWDLYPGNGINAGGGTKVGAATVDMTWSWPGSDNWAMGGVSIKPSFGNELWISADQDSGTGADGLPGGWREGEVLNFGGPGLTLGTTTAGDFSSAIDFDSFTADASDPGSLHFVSRDLTIGSGADQFGLQIGDVLVSFNQPETILATYHETGANTVVDMNDLLAFRPDAPGDYTSGTFYMLLNGVPYPGGGAISNLNAISLVEQDTYVGNTLLTAGSFLYSEQNGSGANTPNHIYHFTATAAGQNAAAGTSQILIDGNDIDIEVGSNIRGLDLIEKSIIVGGMTLDAGDILVTLSVDDASVGDNGLDTSTSDIFVLKVTQSEPETGNTTTATAEMIFDGSQVNFDSADGERVYAISLVPDNRGPAIGGNDTGAVTEDVGVSGGNISTTGTLTIADPDAGESSFMAETIAGTCGSLAIDVAGIWTYTADNSQAAIQSLNNGDALSDIFIVTTADGTTQRVTITIYGADEAPVNTAPIARPDGVHLSFDGNDLITIADDFSLQMTNNVTMEAWINHSGSGTGSQIIVNKEGEYEMGITADTGEIIYAIADSLSNWTWHNTGYFVTAGEWTHVAVTFDGIVGEINTYINGALVDTFAQPGPMGDVYGTYNDLTIGGRENATDQRFQGLIDEVRIWRTTRSPGEIQSNMTGLLTGAEAGLAGNWRLDEGSTGVVADQSANGNNGTLGGAEGPSATPAYQGYYTDEDTQLNIPAGSGVLANDVDVDGDALSVTNLDTTGMIGTLVLNPADGSFTYNPNGAFESLRAGEHVIETFTYTANDGSGDSETVTVTITVTGVNDAALAVADGFTVSEGSTTNLNLAINDSDADDGLDLSSISIVSGPSNGSVVVNNNGTVDYTHNGSETTADSFTYTIADQTGAISNTVAVSLTIVPQNDAPTIANIIPDQVATEDAAFTFIIAANTFSDVDTGDSLTYTVSGMPGWLSFDAATRTFSGTPANADVGTVTVTVRATDGSAAFVEDQFDITVVNANHVPVISGTDTGAITKNIDPDGDGLLAVNGALTISDPDAGESSFRAGTVAGAYGSLSIDAAGNWNYAADNTQAAIQQLNTGESIDDLLTVTTADGTTHNIIVTINGATTIVDPGGDDPGPGPVNEPIEPDPEPEPELPPDEILPTEDELPHREASAAVNLSSSRPTIITPQQWAGPTVFVPTISLLKAENGLPNDTDSTPVESPSSIEPRLSANTRPLQTAVRIPFTAAELIANQAMTEQLDHISQQMADTLAWEAQKRKIFIGTASGFSASMLVGYVVWALRGVPLFLSALAAMPMWRCFDPLPVLTAYKPEEDENEDEEPVQDLFGTEKINNDQISPGKED